MRVRNGAMFRGLENCLLLIGDREPAARGNTPRLKRWNMLLQSQSLASLKRTTQGDWLPVVIANSDRKEMTVLLRHRTLEVIKANWPLEFEGISATDAPITLKSTGDIARRTMLSSRP